jgi:precorrin-6y C5,15-methyltransferase (decarboxylating) CbiE subunit
MAEIVIVGCGPGATEYLPPVGRAAIDQAEVVVGAARLLEAFAPKCAERIVVGADVAAALDAMAGHVGHKNVVVLVTGDPGLASFAKPVRERFGRASCRVIPGISAVQTAFARIGLDWEDACIVSAHNEVPSRDLAGQKKIAVLAGGEKCRSWLVSLGVGREIFVCENLTLPEERVRKVSVAELETMPLVSLTVVLFIAPEVL